jgi:hypothetical protein
VIISMNTVTKGGETAVAELGGSTYVNTDETAITPPATWLSADDHDEEAMQSKDVIINGKLDPHSVTRRKTYWKDVRSAGAFE